MSHRLTATFQLFFFSICFSFFFRAVISDSCLQTKCRDNFTCVFEKRKCECKLGYALNKTDHCIEQQCGLSVSYSCSEHFSHTECIGERCKCSISSYEGVYEYDETSNTCLIPPNRTKELLVIILPTVVGILTLTAIIGVFVWKYKRTKKQNQKTFHFRSGGDGAFEVHTLSSIDAQQASLNDHQMVLNNSDAFFSAVHHQTTQEQSLPVYSTPVDFPPPYSVVDYGGPSTSFANPNSASLTVTHQPLLLAPGDTSGNDNIDSNPYSPLASSKLTML